MKASIVTTIIGCFGVSEDGNIIAYVKFPKDPEKIVEKIRSSKKGTIPEEKKIEEQLKKKGFTYIRKSDSELIQTNLKKLAIEKKFVKDQAELSKLISRVNIELTKIKIKEAVSRDALIIQTNGAIEELDKSINILMERLREWYGLHFPEMNRIISKHEKYAELIEKFGSRENMRHPELSHFRKKSMGTDLNPADVKIVQGLAKDILELYKLRDTLSYYLEKLVKEVAPNLNELAGPVLAAKLISLAGGLERIARMPSSTIQLLGAEKALFRHLHGRGKSPKHGIIIMHKYIQNTPPKYRGKIARLISSKLSIAAKMDFYSRKDKGKEMRKDLEKKIKQALKPK